MATGFDLAVSPVLSQAHQIPLMRRVAVGFEAVIISLKTMRRAVACDNAPYMRSVRFLAVANTLSMGFAVHKWSSKSKRPQHVVGRIKVIGRVKRGWKYFVGLSEGVTAATSEGNVQIVGQGDVRDVAQSTTIVAVDMYWREGLVELFEDAAGAGAKRRIGQMR